MKQSPTQKITIGNQPVKSDKVAELIPQLSQANLTLWDSFNDLPRLMDLKKNDDIHELSETIGVWSGYVGYDINENEIILINQFIRRSYGTLNLQDIKEAIEMSTDGRIVVSYFGTFAPLYVGNVLSQFKKFRSNLFSQIRYAISEYKKLQTLPVPEDSERIENYQFIFRTAYQDARAGTYHDIGSLVYNYLTEKKLIEFTPQLIEDAEAYAKRERDKDKKKDVLHSVVLGKSFDRSNKSIELKMLKREYCVNNWFRSKTSEDIEKFIQDFKL